MQKHPTLPQAFADLGIEVRFLKALAEMGYETPSEIQEKIIPPALAGTDIMGQARTGTGKTAAFGLPILQKLDPAGRVQAICLAPTRELAVQVTGELKRLAAHAQLHVIAIYGGQKIATQLHLLGKKPHFVVGTPGRVIDFLRRGQLDIRDIKFAVLDEVDRMLDIGFRDDIREILSRVKSAHQTIFVSATIDDEIKRLARRYMHDPLDINVSRDSITVAEVDQFFVSVEPYDKFQALKLLMKQENSPVSIVFCNTKAGARKLAKKLFQVGIEAKEIHGDLIQAKRDRVMEGFRRHKIRVLVATDLAARGIDVSQISHIINYDIPPDPQVYVHRIGRTARMGARGTAISFITTDEGKELTNIEKHINREVVEHKIEGFKPSARARPETPPAPKPVSRLLEPLHASAKDAAGLARPKNLGARFKTKRRRRL